MLLSSTLWNFVSSYLIDTSCQDYKGQNIEVDIHEIMSEVIDMSNNALARISSADSSANHLLQSLFGPDPSKYATLSHYFDTFGRSIYSQSFIIVCDDLMVDVDITPSNQLRWIDRDHHWILPYMDFTPCNPARKLGAALSGTKSYAVYAIDKYIVYLCPATLDNPKGRLLAPYRSQNHGGDWINDYMLTPMLMFNELLDMNPGIHGKS